MMPYGAFLASSRPRGSNSGVEFLPSKQAVAGSNPVSRSNAAL